MTHPQLVICGYGEAAMYLRRTAPRDVAGVISVCGGRGECRVAVDGRECRRLDLSFDDVDVPDPSDELDALRVHARQRWAAENGLAEVPPNVSDAAAIIDFARTLHPQPGVVLCHCAGGVSRAPAAALICLAVWEGPGREEACVEHVLTVRPAAAPHRGLVRLADSLLGRKGALSRALATVTSRTSGG